MFPHSIIGAIEIYGKYITWDWYEITPRDFLDTRVVTRIISIRKFN